MSESLSVSKLVTVGEHIELEVGDDIASSPRYNEDIAPTKASQRTWTRWNVASLWVGMAICVPTYTLGGVLTAYFGLSVAEALWTILIANIVVLIPLTLNAYPGTRYGIPCPVVMRASFGIIGSNVPVADSRGRRLRLVWRADAVRRHRYSPDALGAVRRLGRAWAAPARYWASSSSGWPTSRSSFVAPSRSKNSKRWRRRCCCSWRSDLSSGH